MLAGTSVSPGVLTHGTVRAAPGCPFAKVAGVVRGTSRGCRDLEARLCKVAACGSDLPPHRCSG